MRGKIVVILMLAFSVAFGLFGVWYFGTRSPLDQRFNLNRKMAPQDGQGLLPDRVGDFRRQALNPISGDAGSADGSATYSDVDGKPITLAVSLIDDPSSALAALDASYVLHKDAKFPFGYSANTPTGQTFIWINGPWRIQASTKEATADALLQFVNAYAF
jgi:hypothetical protein